ncbi:MAG: TonB-dependent receptor [Candidatus Solibacter sp.]
MSSRTRLGVLVLSACIAATVAFGQIRSATITGAVTDASGAVIAGAEVTVTEQQTAISNTTKTTDSGSFTVPYLPAGTYAVAIKVTGFADYRVTGLTVTTGQTVRQDAQMKLATLGSAVEVTASAQQIQTDSSTVQGSITSQAIDIVPNPTSNPLYYAFLQAGVVPRVQAANTTTTDSFGIGTTGRRQWAAVGINGGRAWTNDIQLDGLPVMSGGYNEVAVTPNTEGLAEVTVIANTFSAQYGHGQGILSMNTKSGTNQYHGEGSYTLRNEALMANTRANKANYSTTNPMGIARPPFKVNELGGAIGGPIIKDKLFFFTSYHYLRFNRGITSLQTVPTELEQVGNFSQTLVRNEAGVGVPAQIYDPWNVTQINADLYQRALIPNGNLQNYPGSTYGKTWFSYYPKPNRTPDDVFNTNNFQSTVVQQLRRHNLNTRVDYRRGKHSLYGSGGLTKSSNVTPRAYGKAPLNDQASVVSDNNPFAQLGDTIVVSPTLVLDVRYGVSRINSLNWSGNQTGWTAETYKQFGLPENIWPLFAMFGTAPSLPMSSGAFGKASEHQANHSLASSVTKMKGPWTLKYGVEVRNLFSNYTDFEESTAQYPSTWFDVGGNFNFQYVTASGGSSNQNTTVVQNGITNARSFLSAPGWWIRPGANVRPAFSQKYFAVYAQQDWRASSKLTLNLGFRWDLQPGPTERYNRMSAVDLEAKNPFGYQGAIAFPGINGYSRNLWNTTYTNIGPRVGGAYQVNPNLVVRGGYGVTYLPSNSGYFASPVDYGTSPFSSGTMQTPYGASPNGVPAIHLNDSAFLNIAPGGDPGAAGVYGTSEAKFDRHFKNGRATQYNVFIERRFAGPWMASIGYSGASSANLFNRNFAINSNQLLPTDLLNTWKDSYVASNLTLNPASVLVPNPFQPTDGSKRPFTGSLGNATIARQSTYNPYPLLLGLGLNQSKAWARYNSLQARLSRAFTSGFHMDLNYTWSKELDNSDTMEDNQYGNPGGTATGLDIKNLKNNMRFGGSDVTHRMSGIFLFDLPFGSGKAINPSNKVLNHLLSGWQTGSTLSIQTGFPIFISGDSNGALIGHPDRVAGVPLEVPKELQHWYDGNTSVTLPNGRSVKPAKNTFLKFYTGAFTGRYITLPNGKFGYDQNWVGTVANNLDELRGPGRFNIDMSLRRNIKLRERMSLEISAEAANLLNSSQQSGSYAGALGNTTVTPNASIGLVQGMGSSDTYGTIGNGTFPAREVVMNMRLRF